ncbi:MAG TPA: aminoglycoside 3'-phosphotransferase [Solirubrobacteraceae bacterium]|nr:aminoglycoside 3'-phosphotransferase [Solirubrobacteraceae bacterium]
MTARPPGAERPPLAGPPHEGFPVPPRVRELAAGASVRGVWLNQLGGSTWELGTGAGRRFVKWAPRGCGLDLEAEAARLRWAGRFVRVPAVLGAGDEERGAWLLLEALAGESAVSERWRAEPERAARAIGQGLRLLHDRLPVDSCPFSWSVAERLARAGAEGLARTAPAIDRLVVCHGDACAPNTLLSDDGGVAGHVDLGALGVADRWADLAVATWSMEWNYGPGLAEPLLEAYGIAPDEERIAFYRLLWDLT